MGRDSSLNMTMDLKRRANVAEIYLERKEADEQASLARPTQCLDMNIFEASWGHMDN